MISDIRWTRGGGLTAEIHSHDVTPWLAGGAGGSSRPPRYWKVGEGPQGWYWECVVGATTESGMEPTEDKAVHEAVQSLMRRT